MKGRWKSVAGFSYVEILLAVVLLAACLIPAMEALQSAYHGVSAGQSQRAGWSALESRLEELLAEPLAALGDAAAAAGGPGVPTWYSDPAGSVPRRLVYLVPYDADNSDGDGDPFTGGDVDLIWVRVALEESAHALDCLATAQ